MKKILSIAVLSALSLCSQVQAADVSYNYVQAGLIRADVEIGIFEDTANFKPTGYSLKGSFGVTDNIYILGGYRDVDKSETFDGDRYEVGLNEFNLGLGYHIEATENADLLFELEYLRDELEASVNSVGGNIDTNGFRAGVGLRGKASDNLELYGKINYSNLGKVNLDDETFFDFGNGFGAQLGGVISVNDTWGITVEYQLDKRGDGNSSQFGLGVRASF